jgi:uncharacterized membrane protein
LKETLGIWLWNGIPDTKRFAEEQSVDDEALHSDYSRLFRLWLFFFSLSDLVSVLKISDLIANAMTISIGSPLGPLFRPFR